MLFLLIYLTESAEFSAKIDGSDGGWKLPLPPVSSEVDSIQPIRPENDPGCDAVTILIYFS